MKESRLKDLLMKDLTTADYYVRKLVATGNGGFPDIIAAGDSFFLAIEAKTLNGGASFEQLVRKWSKLQLHNARQIISTGSAYILIGSNDRRGVVVLYWLPQTDELPDDANRMRGALSSTFDSYADFYQRFFGPTGYITVRRADAKRVQK